MLDDKNLFNRITIEELEKTIAGEEKARRAIFLSLCSIWLKDQPIHTLVNSESSAGKSYICARIRDVFPKDLYEWRTRISPTTMTYWHNSKFEPEWSWEKKFLYLEDVSDTIINSDVFKVMCSEGSIATVVIKQRAIDVIINGKPTMLLTTANATPSYEILNRFNVICLDESEIQTRRVKERHGKRAVAAMKSNHDDVRAMLGLLKQVEVSIPFAEKIISRFPDEVRARRDYPRFLSLVRASSALHQVQREKTEDGTIIATGQDYSLAREAIHYITSGIPVGLTRRQAQAMQLARECYDMKMLETVDKDSAQLEAMGPLGFTARDVWAYKPIVSESNWYLLLDKLASRNLLTIQLSEPDRKGGRPKAIYAPNDMNAVVLPAFDDL
jgi:hypothetical protein